MHELNIRKRRTTTRRFPTSVITVLPNKTPLNYLG